MEVNAMDEVRLLNLGELETRIQKEVSRDVLFTVSNELQRLQQLTEQQIQMLTAEVENQ